MNELSSHWNDRYLSTPADDLSWFQAVPSTLDLVLDHATPTSSILDVGAGASTLVDHLLAKGIDDVTLLDIAGTAFDDVRRRLDTKADVPVFIEGDLRRWVPDRTYDIWHDRAVLHFMVSDDDQMKYRRALASALRPGGVAVIATFAEQGPENCAGLPTKRYTAESLAASLSPALEPVVCRESTPDASGDSRPYVECVFIRSNS